MPLRDWLSRRRDHRHKKPAAKKTVPEGVWSKCTACAAIIYRRDLVDNLFVCPECGYHYRMSAWQRINLLVDNNSFTEWDAALSSKDPLKFKAKKNYTASLAAAKKKTGLREAVVTGKGAVAGVETALAVMDFNFIGGSMGSAVGEKITRLIERAAAEKLPLVIVVSSGGARMQEGMFSLLQMAKTSGAVAAYSRAGLPYISVLTNPTLGGVSASFALLADIIIAEPRALIGFAGPRIIEQAIKQKLPKDFQSSESMLKNGQIDMIVERRDLRSTLKRLLTMLSAAEVAGG